MLRLFEVILQEAHMTLHDLHYITFILENLKAVYKKGTKTLWEQELDVTKIVSVSFRKLKSLDNILHMEKIWILCWWLSVKGKGSRFCWPLLPSSGEMRGCS